MPLVDHGMLISTVNTQKNLTHSYDKTNAIETRLVLPVHFIIKLYATYWLLEQESVLSFYYLGSIT